MKISRKCSRCANMTSGREPFCRGCQRRREYLRILAERRARAARQGVEGETPPEPEAA